MKKKAQRNKLNGQHGNKMDPKWTSLILFLWEWISQICRAPFLEARSWCSCDTWGHGSSLSKFVIRCHESNTENGAVNCVGDNDSLMSYCDGHGHSDVFQGHTVLRLFRPLDHFWTCKTGGAGAFFRVTSGVSGHREEFAVLTDCSQVAGVTNPQMFEIAVVRGERKNVFCVLGFGC